MHIHTHTHTNTRTHKHTCVHAHTHTHTHTHTHKHVHKHTHTHLHVHAHTHTCTHTHTHTHTHTCTCTSTDTHTCTHNSRIFPLDPSFTCYIYHVELSFQQAKPLKFTFQMLPTGSFREHQMFHRRMTQTETYRNKNECIPTQDFMILINFIFPCYFMA